MRNLRIEAGAAKSRRGTHRFRPSPESLEGRALLADAMVSSGVTGELSAVSQRGASPAGMTTNVNRLSFDGKATPQAIVELFGQQADTVPTRIVSLGRTVVDAAGRWSLTTDPLPDGTYTITASMTESAGLPSPVSNLLTGPIQIDTIAPRVRALDVVPKHGAITVAIQDTGSGIDPAILQKASYVVIGPRGLGSRLIKIHSITPTVSGFYSNAQAVTLHLDAPLPLRRGVYRLQIAAGRVTDRAGNPLDGEFTGTFPSGDGRAGGNFLTSIIVGPSHRRSQNPHTSKPGGGSKPSD